MKVSTRQLEHILTTLPDPRRTTERQIVKYVTEDTSVNVPITSQISTAKMIVFNLERLMFRDSKGAIHDMSYWTIDI